MQIKLYNNRTRQLEIFLPENPDRVSMYLCGPTVYNYIHIGNARGPVVFGLLARLLRRHFSNVVYARNITDIEDKINQAASEQQVPIHIITERFTHAYHSDMAALGADVPDQVPHATHHIAEIIAMCERLIASGHAYAVENHVLFAVDSYPDYGKLSRRSTEEMLAGARVEVAPYKRNPGDFVLWKPSTPDLPGWESPWGRGRPGWHIECSAMCEALFGDTLDIHAGGIDLQFPHHENEVAQSTCAHDGKIYARFWLHNGMLNMGGRKMSKSLGNISRVRDLIALYPPEALRYALLSAHYSQPLDWSDNLIDQSIRTLDRLYGTLRELADVDIAPHEYRVPESFEAALCDDLNTPQALAALSQLAADARKAESANDRKTRKAELLGAGALIGLIQQPFDAWFARNLMESGLNPADIERLLHERQQAKQLRDFTRADSIRRQLAEQGIDIEDTATGSRWKVANK